MRYIDRIEPVGEAGDDVHPGRRRRTRCTSPTTSSSPTTRSTTRSSSSTRRRTPSPEQMKMFLTRLGFGSKIVVTGDVTQVDLPGGTRAGCASCARSSTTSRTCTSPSSRRRRRPAPAGRRHRRRLRALGRSSTAARPAARAAVELSMRRGRQRVGVSPSTSPSWSACARYVLGADAGPPAWPSCRVLLVDEARDGDPARAVDGRAGPDRRLAFPMDELRRRARRGADRQERPSSATSCCARASPRGRPREAGHATEDELLLLTTHGILHLLGYDHAEPEEEKEMFGLQRQLLAQLASPRAAARPPEPARKPAMTRLVTAAVLAVLAASSSPPPRRRFSRVSRSPRRGAARARAPGRAGARAGRRRHRRLPLGAALPARSSPRSTVAVMVTLAVVELVEGTWQPFLAAGRDDGAHLLRGGRRRRRGTLGAQHSTRVALAAAPATVVAAAACSARSAACSS